MARLFRASYTRPIRAETQIVTVKGKPHARYVDRSGRGKARTVPLTKNGKRLLFFSKVYSGQYRRRRRQGDHGFVV